MIVFWVVAFVAVVTIVGVGEVVVKFAVNAGSEKKLGFVKVLIPLRFYEKYITNKYITSK